MLIVVNGSAFWAYNNLEWLGLRLNPFSHWVIEVFCTRIRAFRECIPLPRQVIIKILGKSISLILFLYPDSDPDQSETLLGYNLGQDPL